MSSLHHGHTINSPDEPLSQLELAILLALPRAAQKSPDSIIFKIPKSDDPHLGFVDTTCSEASSIVARLINIWNARLSEVFGASLNEKRGTVIAIGVQPEVHAWFHHMAFWALGCGIQYFNTNSEPSVIESLLKLGNCSAILHSGQNLDNIVRDCGQKMGVPVIALPEDEYAIHLSESEQSGTREAAPDWPTPRRPVPAVILQTSASTNNPKLLRFPLQHWALTLEMFIKRRAAQENSSQPPQPSPEVQRPRLLIYPCYWMTTMNILLLHLVTHAPLALVHKDNISSLSGQEILDWLLVSNANHLFSLGVQAKDMLQLAFNENGHPKDSQRAEALTSLESIAITGTNFDRELSNLFVKCNVKATNTFGNSELGSTLSGSRPPYTYLRPSPGQAPPLTTPFEDNKDTDTAPTEDQSIHPRLVQLWTLVSTHPHLSKNLVQGNMPITIEPYPGPGLEHGQAAVKWGDLFYELEVPLDSPAADGSTTETVLTHAGRVDDLIRLSTGEDLNASEVEAALRHALDAQLQDIDRWTVDAVQVFGTNRPHTAAVVQLRSDDEEADGQKKVVALVQRAVDDTNKQLKLAGSTCIDVYGRLLIISTTGQCIGPSPDNREVANTLALTHKRTIQRWKNNQRFEAWLDKVCC